MPLYRQPKDSPRRPQRLCLGALAQAGPFALAALLIGVAAMPIRAQDAAPDTGPDAAAQGAAAVVEEPTEEQIRTAYAQTLETVNAGTVSHLGAADAAALTIELEDIVKLGCRGLNRPGAQFECRVERRTRRGDERPTTDVVELWLSWEDGRWVAR
jgi:hypothetical protein